MLRDKSREQGIIRCCIRHSARQYHSEKVTEALVVVKISEQCKRTEQHAHLLASLSFVS